MRRSLSAGGPDAYDQPPDDSTGPQHGWCPRCHGPLCDPDSCKCGWYGYMAREPDRDDAREAEANNDAH